MTTPNTSFAAMPTDHDPRMTEHGLGEAAVRDELDRLCARDHSYAGGTIFNSICSEPLPLAAEVFARHLSANSGDSRIFPGLHEAERRVTAMLGDLLGDADAHGVAVSGGTEANLLAVAAALRGRPRRAGRPQLLVPESAHFSLEKVAALLDCELVCARLDARYRVDIDDMRRKISTRTALVVVTAGTSECGAVDDVPAAAQIAREAGLPLHVDAATGGFLIPFARELGYTLPAFDLSVPGVTSMAVDPHKYGQAPIPCGWLLVRERSWIERLRSESHYQGTRAHYGLLGTRPGASVLAAYAALRAMGRAGYRAMVAELFAMRAWLLERLAGAGLRLAFEPELTVVGVQSAEPEAVLARLEADGLLASVARRHGFLRLVLHRHLRREHLDVLVRSLSPRLGQEVTPCA